MNIINLVDGGEKAIVIAEPDLRQIVSDAERFEQLFFDLLRISLTHCHEISEVRQWMQYNYIDIRGVLPSDLKTLYLQKIAFHSIT